MNFTVTTAEVKNINLALYLLKKYYPFYVAKFPADSYQSAVLAALESEPLTETREISNSINNTIRREMRAAGFRVDPDTRKFTFLPVMACSDGGAIKLDFENEGDRCGVPGCGKKAYREDVKYRFLCFGCDQYIYRNKGIANGIEYRRRGGRNRKLVVCGFCKKQFYREVAQIKKHVFCSKLCWSKYFAKSKKARGAAAGKAKLNELKIGEIRLKFGSQVSAKELSFEYGVTTRTIWQIVKFETWKHVSVVNCNDFLI